MQLKLKSKKGNPKNTHLITPIWAIRIINWIGEKKIKWKSNLCIIQLSTDIGYVKVELNSFCFGRVGKFEEIRGELKIMLP